MRGNVIFDECGFLSDEMMSVYSAFAIVNKSFKSGKDRDGNRIDEIRLRAIPKEIPNQKFYISSASDTSTKYYSLYREFSKQMLMGNKDYFVANITCDIPLHPTIHGQVMAPLFEKSTIDADMRTNPEKARREYYCEFTTDAGSDAIIRRGVISRNEEVRKPLLYNDTGDKKFVIAYDPARSRDNSVILVGEIYEFEQIDGSTDIRMRLVNCINLIDVGKKIKSPMQTPDQIEYLKKVILNTKMIKLDWQDKIALANMDALKEELVNMVRKKRDSGKDSFELTPEKANKLHDDRALNRIGYFVIKVDKLQTGNFL